MDMNIIYVRVSKYFYSRIVALITEIDDPSVVDSIGSRFRRFQTTAVDCGNFSDYIHVADLLSRHYN